MYKYYVSIKKKNDKSPKNPGRRKYLTSKGQRKESHPNSQKPCKPEESGVEYLKY
jgi:hypothetical protein